MRRFISISCIVLIIFIFAGCGTKIPKAPQKFQAVFETENVIKLTWEKAENADYYRLYRRQADDTDFKYICDIKSCEYSDSSILGDKTYIYKITAVNNKGESLGTESKAVSYSNGLHNNSTAVAVPDITSVTNMDKYTNVIIFEDKNADCKYEVFRSDRLKGSYASIGITEFNSFYDENINRGVKYYYKVKAVSDTGESGFSQAAPLGTNSCRVYNVPIFMYHEFVTQEDLNSGVAFDEYAIYKHDFESDLLWLKNNGYTTITTKQLADFLEGRGTLPAKPVILTIDDGKLGVYKNAYPLLKEYGMIAVLAVIGTRIDLAAKSPDKRANDEAPYCTWDEIAEMSHSGAVEIVSHSYAFHIFNHTGRQGASTAEDETVESYLPNAQKDYMRMQQKLKEVIGTGTVTLSYPYSKRTAVSDNTWLKCGYKILLAGDGEDVRQSRTNYFVREAGINEKSALVRRIVRMNGTHISKYMKEARE